MSFFKGLDISALEDVDTPTKQSKRPLNEGWHEDMVIGDAEIVEAKDPNWRSLKIAFTKQDCYDKYNYVLFPINEEGVKGYFKSPDVPADRAANASQGLLIRLREFVVALGFEDEAVIKLSGLFQVLDKVLSKPEKLIGKRTNIEIGFGYKSIHPIYREKDVYHLCLEDGEVLMDAENMDKPAIFKTAKDAVEHARAFLEGNIQQYPSILKIVPPTTANDLRCFGGQKSAPVDNAML